jgi:hypothetical protein
MSSSVSAGLHSFAILRTSLISLLPIFVIFPTKTPRRHLIIANEIVYLKNSRAIFLFKTINTIKIAEAPNSLVPHSHHEAYLR